VLSQAGRTGSFGLVVLVRRGALAWASWRVPLGFRARKILIGNGGKVVDAVARPVPACNCCVTWGMLPRAARSPYPDVSKKKHKSGGECFTR